MSQQYGLIHPKKDAPKLVKLSAFDSDSDSDTNEPPNKKPNVNIGLIQKKQIARAHNAALTEDPTIFQYDELYDDIKNERESAKVVKKSEEKTVKYIGKLLESADRRKKEFERRIERQVQKERETEGDMYKDKEAFITSSYKQKLEEMKKAEEEEKRFDYLESIGDVTKQRDLGGFYRHLYEQKMGAKVPADSTQIETETNSGSSIPENGKTEDETLKIKKTKEHVQRDRVYRKRKSSGQDKSDDEEESSGDDVKAAAKKAHLQSNLDADSDFSIDSDSDEQEKADEESDNKSTQQKNPLASNNDSQAIQTNESQVNSINVTKDKKTRSDGKVEEKKVDDVIVEERNDVPKIDKKKIWEKRTVGDVLVAAIQRYFERKLLREG